MRKSTFLAAILCLIPVASEAKTLEELLVEKGVITKGEATRVGDSSTHRTYWNQGTRLEFPDTGFTTKVITQLQPRYTFNDLDEDVGASNESSFQFRRARLIVEGTALNNEFSYRLQAEMFGRRSLQEEYFGAGSSGARSPQLLDAWLQWNACDEQGGVRMGQFKPQISRQWNVESQGLQFADRSLASEYHQIDRQNGAMAFGNFFDGMVQANAAIFNGSSNDATPSLSTGEGINAAGIDTNHTAAVGVRLNPVGKMNSYEEGDIDWTEDAAVSLGAAYAYSDGDSVSGSVVDETDIHHISVDGNFKWQGWSFHGELFNRSVRPDIAEKSETTGFYAQAGYFIMPKKLELAARYGYIDCDSGKGVGLCAGLDKINEVSGTLNYHFWRHNMKAQLGWSHVNLDTGAGGSDADRDANRWMFQLSSFF
jgi:phosphate-selective porin OprO and OprP